MALPFFYIDTLPAQGTVTLSEETSKHIVQVLRMENNEQLKLTDGKGLGCVASIIDNNRKRCTVQIISAEQTKRPANKITLAISPVKNNSRFEWLLEKATEIGVSAIVPIICIRTEKQHFKWERMQSILISAMLQSQQSWLPILNEPIKLDGFIAADNHVQQFIAHCTDEIKQPLITTMKAGFDAVILIGPEGDFTNEEIAAALNKGFVPVSLGETRLRTETAGLVAATLLVNAQ